MKIFAEVDGPGPMLRRIKRSAAGEAATAFVLVGLVGGIAGELRETLGEAGFAEILLLPVLLGGALFRLRTALAAAVLAYAVFDFVIEGPSLAARRGMPGDPLALLTFILAALIASVSARALREARWRAASWSRTMRIVMDSTAFFAVTPNEDAILLTLAQAIAALTKAGAVVTDREGRLRFRAGPGADWTGELEDELRDFAWTVLYVAPDHIVNRGRFRARLIRSAGEVLGVVIWRRPRRPRARNRARLLASDEHIALLADHASAAIVNVVRDNRVRTRRGPALASRPPPA